MAGESQSTISIQAVTFWRLQGQIVKLVAAMFVIDIAVRVTIGLITGSAHSWWDEQYVSLSDWMCAAISGYLARGWIDVSRITPAPVAASSGTAHRIAG